MDICDLISTCVHKLIFFITRDMECSDYFPNVKEQDLDNSREMKTERRVDLLSVDDYSYSAHMRPPLGDQYPYNSFGNLIFPDLMEPGRDVNFQLSSLGYQINGNFDLPHSLVPNAGPCAISMLDDNSYPPVSMSQFCGMQYNELSTSNQTTCHFLQPPDCSSD